MSETLSDVVVKIRADMSDVAPQIEDLAKVITEVGTQAEAAGKAMEDGLSRQIETLGAQGMTLAEAMSAVDDSIEQMVTPASAAGEALAATTVQMEQLAAVPLIDATEQLNLFAKEAEAVGGSAEQLSAFGTAAEQLGPPLAGAAEQMASFGEATQGVIERQAELEAAEASAATALQEVYRGYQEGTASAEELARAQRNLADAAEAAAAAGEKIAEGASAGAAAADALAGSLTAAVSSATDFDSQVEALVTSGSTLAEALAKVQAETAGVASGIEDVATAAAPAAEQMNLLGEAMQVPAGMADQLGQVASELEPIGSAAETAADGLGKFGQAEDEVRDGSEKAENSLASLAKGLIDLGEALLIAEGLKAFSEAALEAADTITRASISLTALTGSATLAKEQIEAIEAVGISDGLALPSLLQASTRMTALLGSAANVPVLLGKIADGAAVMGTDIARAADLFDRLAMSGTLGARQLMPLGLSLELIADAMNKVTGSTEATAENVAKMFKAMDQAERIEVLSTAFDRLAGTAQKAAEATFGGQWQSLANQWEQAMSEVGKALLPVISRLIDLMKVDIVPWIKGVIEGFNQLPEPIRNTVVAVGALSVALPTLFLGLGGAAQGFVGMAESLPIISRMMTALGVSAAGLGSTIGLVVVPAIAAAIVILHDYNAAMAATNEAEKALTVQFQAYMTHLVSAASTTEQVAAAQDKVKLALDQGAISADFATKSLGHLDTMQKALVGSNFNDYLGSMGMHFSVLKTETQNLMSPTEGLQIKMKVLADDVKTASQALADAEAGYHGTAEEAKKVADAYDNWQSATKSLKSAQEALTPELKKQQEAVESFTKSATELWNKLPETYDAYLAQLAEGGQAAKSILSQVASEINKAETSMESMKGAPLAAMQAVIDKLKETQKTAQDFAAQDVWSKAIEKITADEEKAALISEQAELTHQTALLEIQSSAAAQQESLHQITASQRIAIDNQVEDQEAALQLEALQNEKATLDASVSDQLTYASKLAAINAKIQSLQDKTLSKQATQDIKDQAAAYAILGVESEKALTTQIKNTEESIAALQKAGAAQGLIYAGQEKELALEVQLAERTGADATKQLNALNSLDVAQRKLYDTTHASQLDGIANAQKQVEIDENQLRMLQQIGAPLAAQDAAYQKLIADQVKQAELQGNWQKAQALVLAGLQDQLNLAVKLNEPLGTQLKLQGEIYQQEIINDELSGKSATDQVLGLMKVNLQMRALADSATLMGNTIKAVTMNIVDGLENIGSSISQVIVEGGNLGQAFVDIGKKILETILTTIINAGMRALIDSIVGTGVPIAAMATHMTAAATTMQASMGAALTAIRVQVEALSAEFVKLGATIQTVVGTPGGMTGAAGGLTSAASGIFGLINVITGIAQAIEGLVNIIQNIKIEKTLSLIEQNTRYLQIEAEKFFQHDVWQIHTEVLDKFDMLYDRLADIWNTLIAGFTLLSAGGAASGGAEGLTKTDTLYGPSQPILGTGAEHIGPESTLSQSTYNNLNTSSLYPLPTISPQAGLPQPTLPGAAQPGTWFSNLPPSTGATTATPTSSPSGGTTTVTFHITEAQNPRETARQIAQTLKLVSPRFAFGAQ